MKCHVFLYAHQHVIIDLDKRLPFIKTLFSSSKIEKKEYANAECVIVKDINKDITLKSIKEKSYGIKLQLDFYTFSLLGLSLVDINFEVKRDFVQDIICDLKPFQFLFKSIMVMDGKEQSISNLFTTVLFDYFQQEKLIKITSEEKYLAKTRETVQQIREVLIDQLNSTYFFTTDSPADGISGQPGSIIIIDDENEVSIDHGWESIGASNNQVYRDTGSMSTYLLKEKKYIKEMHQFAVEICRQDSLMSCVGYLTQSWMGDIKNQGNEIRSNIALNNENKYYWRELKKDIEIMDLNFLEFHTQIISNNDLLGKFPNTMELEFSKIFIKEFREHRRKARNNVFQLLNEVKYAINNLSTPGHTHDEHLLQEETEKVHERLLLISFIAMAIPCGVTIISPEIDIFFKIIAASAIISIPLIYFIFRKIQKVIAYKRNIQSDLKRQLRIEKLTISRSIEANERLKTMEDFPDDIKEGIIELNQKGIDSQERRIDMLEKKL